MISVVKKAQHTFTLYQPQKLHFCFGTGFRSTANSEAKETMSMVPWSFTFESIPEMGRGFKFWDNIEKIPRYGILTTEKPA